MFQISLEKISLLVTINFGVQLLTDMLAVKYVDKIGYRVSAVFAHIMSAVGLIGLAVFPYIFPSEYIGLIIAVVVTQ